MFSFPSGQRLVEHILVDISWIMVVKLCGKKKKGMLDEKMGKVAKGEKKNKKKKRKERRSVPLCS